MPRVAHPSWQSLEALEARQLLAFVLWDGGGGDSDWDNRELCSDGSCIGVIGKDGKCNECGKAAGSGG